MADTDKKTKNSGVGLPLNLIVNSLCICLFVCLLMFMSPAVFAKGDIIQFRHDAPNQHVVVPGDTLWDISATFLSDPWLWPKVWRANPEIFNPHLIYPGDVIALIYQDGKPQLMLSRGTTKARIALSPEGVKNIKPALGLINWQQVEAFINNDLVLSNTTIKSGIKVIGSPQKLTRMTAQQLLFAHSDPNDTVTKTENIAQFRSKEQYSVVHKQHTIYDMQGEQLGTHVKHVADVQLHRALNHTSDTFDTHAVQVFKVTDSKQEITLGDSIITQVSRANKGHVLMSIASSQRGYVVAGVSTRTRWSQDDVVVIDIGQSETQPGMVFGIYQPESVLLHAGEVYTQPRIKLGNLVVIAAFAKTSFGVIVNANSVIQRGAQIKAP